MDDIRLVGDLFAEPPPPSPEVIAAARARLPLSRARRRRARLRIALPGTAVAAAAIAITVLVVSAAPGPGNSRPGVPASMVYHFPPAARARAGSVAAGRRILLTAADAVARRPADPPAPGRWWVSRTEVGNFLVVGPAGDPYVILERAAGQDWSGTSRTILSPDLVRMLPLQFASPADAAAWRRDGSPRRWNVQVDTSLADPHGTTEGFDHDVTLAGTRLTLVSGFMGGKQFMIGSKVFSAAQLLRLPADPARLKSLLLTDYRPGLEGQGIDAEVFLFETAPQLLTLPVTPAVRSAVYRLLASLPGVRSLGRVEDAAGQEGEAVALDRPYRQCGVESVKYANGGVNDFVPAFRSCLVEQRLVIDPRTGQPLAQELRYLKQPGQRPWPGPDGLFSFQLFQRSYWTNASPPKGQAS